ncbi:hypothetical protein ACFLUS_05250 [Chloroflexota bacterium]
MFFKKLRDKTRDELCAGLCHMGIDVRMSERNRAEEKIGGRNSMGVIDIPDGPIRWIKVYKKYYSASDTSPIDVYHYTDYVRRTRLRLNPIIVPPFLTNQVLFYFTFFRHHLLPNGSTVSPFFQPSII